MQEKIKNLLTLFNDTFGAKSIVVALSDFFVNNFGIVLGRRIARFVDFPLRIKNKISNIGVLETTKLVYNKIHNFILNCIRK